MWEYYGKWRLLLESLILHCTPSPLTSRQGKGEDVSVRAASQPASIAGLVTVKITLDDENVYFGAFDVWRKKKKNTTKESCNFTL